MEVEWVCWKAGVQRNRELSDVKSEKGGDNVQVNGSIQISLTRMC